MNNQKYGFILINDYKMATEQYLKHLFPDYPNEAFISFEVSFDVTPASLNSDLVYAMLDTIPEAFLSVNQHHIKIRIYEEKKLIAHLSEIIDILTIVKAWDILLIEYNAKPIPISEFHYFYEHLLQRNGTKNSFLKKVKLKSDHNIFQFQSVLTL